MTVTIMDGGMGGEIQSRLKGAATGLWSARALVDDPQLVVDIHKEYIDAGAEIIITNSYSSIPSYLEKEGLAARYEELTRIAGKLARRAAEESNQPVRVAGSIPPLEESYRPDLVLPESEASPVYANLVRALEPYVDLFICETMSSAVEAHTAARQAVVHGQGKPVYVSWTLNETPGSGLRSGETVASAYEALQDLPIAAFLFNCTQPEAIETALGELSALTEKPLGCYANRLNEVPKGWTLDGKSERNTRRADLDEVLFADMGQRCVDAGASMVGGCCGIGPSHIRELSQILKSG